MFICILNKKRKVNKKLMGNKDITLFWENVKFAIIRIIRVLAMGISSDCFITLQ